MTFPRKVGILILLVAAAAVAAYQMGLALPTLRWFYSFDADPNSYTSGSWREHQAQIVGHVLCGIMALAGLILIIAGGNFHWNPLTLRKLTRFRSIGRGWLSFQILLALLFLAMLDQTLVGRRALAVKYEGKWSFPAFYRDEIKEKEFGGKSDQEQDYRALKKSFASDNKGNAVIMPPIPWDPVFDSDDIQRRTLEEKEGQLHRPGEDHALDGRAVQYWPDSPTVKLREVRFLKGVRDGTGTLYDGNGEFAGKQTWKEGKLVETSVEDSGPSRPDMPWIELVYPPAAPSFENKHFLGTDSKGWDIAAQLFGGFQVQFKAATIYVALVYSIGIIIGSLMGYLGGTFDLIVDRLKEMLSNIPFLLVVMILAAYIGRDNITLTTIIMIFAIFSWIGVATYLRTATYREKARDYVAAARVQGAGTLRVIFKHILPNAISTIVTLLPFSIAGVAASLTALDFLGFGLPDRYPSWGRLLEDGTSNITSPWIVSSSFGVMVFVLMLITFVGEAIREAFDPKKFTTYQ